MRGASVSSRCAEFPAASTEPSPWVRASDTSAFASPSVRIPRSGANRANVATEPSFAPTDAAATSSSNSTSIAVSGSGNSPNVLRAVEYANANGAQTLAVVGYDGGALRKLAHTSVWVPSFDMQLCEDVHLMFGHMVMKTLCGSSIRL